MAPWVKDPVLSLLWLRSLLWLNPWPGGLLYTMDVAKKIDKGIHIYTATSLTTDASFKLKKILNGKFHVMPIYHNF